MKLEVRAHSAGASIGAPQQAQPMRRSARGTRHGRIASSHHTTRLTAAEAARPAAAVAATIRERTAATAAAIDVVAMVDREHCEGQ